METCANSCKRMVTTRTARPNAGKSPKKEMKGISIIIPVKIVKKRDDRSNDPIRVNIQEGMT